MAADNPLSSRRLTADSLLNWLHLVYLGVLPAVATYSLLAGWPRPEWQRPLIFMGGIALVAVYQAVVFSFAGASRRPWALLLALVDGPIIAWLTGSPEIYPADFAISAFLIDGLAIWLVIAFLAITTDRPSSGQRAATLGFAGAAVITLLAMTWPYLTRLLAGGWEGIGWMAVGVVEAVAVRYFILDRDDPVEEVEQAPAFIVVMVIVWIAAMFAGSIVGDT